MKSVINEGIDLRTLTAALLDELGREINNPEPAFVSVGPQPLTITEQIKRLMRVELSRQAAEKDYETFEESDDFEEVEPDDAPETIYQEERLMKPDWPGPQERSALAKKADLADLDLDEDKTNPEEVRGGVGATPPKKGVTDEPPPAKVGPGKVRGGGSPSKS